MDAIRDRVPGSLPSGREPRLTRPRSWGRRFALEFEAAAGVAAPAGPYQRAAWRRRNAARFLHRPKGVFGGVVAGA